MISDRIANRKLQPSQDKIGLIGGKIDIDPLGRLLETMADVNAFGHLHGSGKLGSATAQDLRDFATDLD